LYHSRTRQPQSVYPDSLVLSVQVNRIHIITQSPAYTHIQNHHRLHNICRYTYNTKYRYSHNFQRSSRNFSATLQQRYSSLYTLHNKSPLFTQTLFSRYLITLYTVTSSHNYSNNDTKVRDDTTSFAGCEPTDYSGGGQNHQAAETRLDRRPLRFHTPTSSPRSSTVKIESSVSVSTAPAHSTSPGHTAQNITLQGFSLQRGWPVGQDRGCQT
jgi:hypothetical protein